MDIFDILGPVMVGPSSSHTAGAARIGLMAREILKEEPKKAVITVYGSFAKTYKGHGTDRALVAGLLGFSADDEMALAILLRFNAMADRRHSSFAARMPRFLIFKRLCSLFIAAKLPSAHIFRFLIMHRYSGVLTLK